MSETVPVRNALLSVYYKNGIVDMARTLHGVGVELYSSGGTAKEIKGAGIPVTDIAEHTGFPPLFGHRVVTLHPKVHGGILFRRDDAGDCSEALKYGITPFDLVVNNLYPVREAIARPGATIDDVMNLTDVGGPAMIRAAAKNHKFVVVVVDPADYMPVAEEIRCRGGLTLDRRRELARKAFRTTEAYDRDIANYL